MPELDFKTKAIHAIQDLIQQLKHLTSSDLFPQYGTQYKNTINTLAEIFPTKYKSDEMFNNQLSTQQNNDTTMRVQDQSNTNNQTTRVSREGNMETRLCAYQPNEMANKGSMPPTIPAEPTEYEKNKTLTSPWSTQHRNEK